MKNLEQFLNIAEAAAFIGVNPATLRNWDKSGKLKAKRHPINGYRIYDIEILKKFLLEFQDVEETENG